MTTYRVSFQHPAGHIETHRVEAPNKVEAEKAAFAQASNAVRNTPNFSYTGRPKASRLLSITKTA